MIHAITPTTSQTALQDESHRASFTHLKPSRRPTLNVAHTDDPIRHVQLSQPAIAKLPERPTSQRKCVEQARVPPRVTQIKRNNSKQYNKNVHRLHFLVLLSALGAFTLRGAMLPILCEIRIA